MRKKVGSGGDEWYVTTSNACVLFCQVFTFLCFVAKWVPAVALFSASWGGTATDGLLARVDPGGPS